MVGQDQYTELCAPKSAVTMNWVINFTSNFAPISRSFWRRLIDARASFGVVQCDQIGRFWNFLVTIFLTKIAQMIADSEYFEKRQFLVKTVLATF